MRILLLGAAGFIGRELLAALGARGHHVVAAMRRPRASPPLGATSVVVIDMNNATEPGAWRTALAGCDAVVNCAGILQAGPRQSIDAIHARAPIALFTACQAAGVRRVVQISAISATRQAGTQYALTKLTADDFLRSTMLEWVVIRPSLVITRGAYGGTALMRAMAALPFSIPVPGDGMQQFQPIHVSDLARVVVQALEGPALTRTTLDAVGPEVVTLSRLLEDYRRWLGFAPARVVRIPRALVYMAARVGDHLGGTLNSTAARQLDMGNTGDFEAFEHAIGFRPRPWRDALAFEPAHQQDRWQARIYFVRPLLRWALALTWVGSAIAGLAALDPWGGALATALAVPVAAAKGLLALLCVADLAIGMLLLLRWRPSRMALAQVAMVVAYTAVASWLWPSLWSDPLGALLKNLPVMGAALALGAIEDER